MTVVQRARLPGSDRLVWLVVGEDHLPVEPIRRYLAYLDDVERSPNTLRAYAHHLKLFWDYLAWAKLAWTDVGLGQLARFMAWLRRHDPDVVPLGEAATRRRESTINTILAAVNSFYEFHERLGSLPVFERYRFGVRPSNANKPFLHHITKGQPVRTRLVKHDLNVVCHAPWRRRRSRRYLWNVVTSATNCWCACCEIRGCGSARFSVSVMQTWSAGTT